MQSPYNMKLQKIRGTVDIYNKKMSSFNYVIDIIKKLAQRYCFEEVCTPIIENSEIFHRTLGEMSDIVNKETYSFIDRDKTNITLRPEFTTPIVRFILSNGMLQSLPLRLFSYGPLFRHERPQKARLRQFHQANFEYIGCSSVHADVELVFLAQHIINKFNISNHVQLKVNTLGTQECISNYTNALVTYLLRYENDLSDLTRQRLVKNPLRILDTKVAEEQKILNNAPLLYNFLNTESKNRFEKVLSYLDLFNINYEVTTRLVRGLDYYSGFVFEFVTSMLGSQGTVLAGGRYDSLIYQMGGKSTPAIGFAAGIERIIELIDSPIDHIKESQIIYLVPIGQNAEEYAHTIAQELRIMNFNVLIDYGIVLKKKMQKANKMNVKYSILFGDDDIKNQDFILKNMHDSKEVKMKKDALIFFLKNHYMK